jgi:regulator of PEP synthase PpsR (kinase-PPPase family)
MNVYELLNATISTVQARSNSLLDQGKKDLNEEMKIKKRKEHEEKKSINNYYFFLINYI